MTAMRFAAEARMFDSVRVASGGFVAFVRSQTLVPRRDLDMLFVAMDITSGPLMHSWLVPSVYFASSAGKPNARGRLRFSASPKPSSVDKWSQFRLSPDELAPRILGRLAELSSND